MRMLGMLGGVANGWLKFFVALAAVGWFGFQALDRVTGFSPAEAVESVESMLVTEETPSNEVAAEDQLIKDDAVKPAVFVSKNIQDMSGVVHPLAPLIKTPTSLRRLAWRFGDSASRE